MFYNREQLARLRSYVFMASFAAWAIIITDAVWSAQGAAAPICGSGWSQELSLAWLWSVGTGWLLMVIAMMAPMLLPPLDHIRISSFSHRRTRSSLLFLFGYVVMWLAALLLMKGLTSLLKQGGQYFFSQTLSATLFSGLIAALLAGVWQLSPYKQWCLNQCYAHPPVAAFGWQADIAALRYGLEHGLWCIGSCWALMLFADSLSQWHVIGMALVAIIMFGERLEPPQRPSWKLRGFRTALLYSRRAMAEHWHARFPPQT